MGEIEGGVGDVLKSGLMGWVGVEGGCRNDVSEGYVGGSVRGVGCVLKGCVGGSVRGVCWRVCQRGGVCGAPLGALADSLLRRSCFTTRWTCGQDGVV